MEIFWIIFQTVKIKILKKESKFKHIFKHISHRSIILKKYEKFYKLLDQLSLHRRTNFHFISYVPFILESRNIILDTCIREHITVVEFRNSRSNAFSLECARVIPSGRSPDQKAGYEWVDSNRTRRERKTPISQAMPGHGARFIRPQENGMPAL